MRHVFARVAGPDGPEHRERIHGTPDRAGSPGQRDRPGRTATRRCSSAGCARCCLQTLHPAAMRAVAEHSGYRGDMWGRLARHQRSSSRSPRSAPSTTPQQAVDAGRAGSTTRVTGHDARRHAVRRLRPAPAGLGARRRGRQLPARPPGLRRRAARPGRPRRLRRRGRPRSAAPARRGRPADAPRPSSRRPWRRTGPELRGTAEAREAVRYVLSRPPLPLAARPASRRCCARPRSAMMPALRAAGAARPARRAELDRGRRSGALGHVSTADHAAAAPVRPATPALAHVRAEAASTHADDVARRSARAVRCWRPNVRSCVLGS